MLKKLWTQINKGLASTPSTETRHYFDMPSSGAYRRAEKVVNTLLGNGYEAYLVGGSIRDALLGFKAKDFDVATNATPEQICRVFSHAKIIGRRFKIVHVRSGADIIEVTTFRAGHDTANSKKGDARQSHKGQLTRDNVYGKLEDDALRRDFTVNALYYDVVNSQVVDFCGGVEDIKQGNLSVIGDPEVRFMEDPVRMIRAVRFSAKLGLTMDKSLQAIIKKNASLLLEVSSHRMFDEVLKLLMHGYGLKTYRLLEQFGMIAYLFPPIHHAMKQLPEQADFFYRFLENGLKNTDKRIQSDLPVTPAYLFAFLLWPAYQSCWAEEGRNQRQSFQKQFFNYLYRVIDAQAMSVAIPNHFKKGIEEIWGLQNLLCSTHRQQSIDKAYQHRRFRAAYDFLLLREQSGEALNNQGVFWTDYQQKHPRPAPAYQPRKRNRR